MTPTRFADFASAYGGDIGNWPIEAQSEAQTLLRMQPDLQALMDAQSGLDASLTSWIVSGPGAALTGRIMTALANQQANAWRWRTWFSGLAAAAALSGGVAAGAFTVMMAPSQPENAGSLYQLTVLGAPLDANTQTAANGPAS